MNFHLVLQPKITFVFLFFILESILTYLLHCHDNCGRHSSLDKGHALRKFNKENVCIVPNYYSVIHCITFFTTTRIGQVLLFWFSGQKLRCRAHAKACYCVRNRKHTSVSTLLPLLIHLKYLKDAGRAWFSVLAPKTPVVVLTN